jgi:hypothetical protein
MLRGSRALPQGTGKTVVSHVHVKRLANGRKKYHLAQQSEWNKET